MILERNHLEKNNISYWGHLFFALNISLRLLTSAILLGLHSILPVVVVPKPLDLKNMTKFLSEKNKQQEERCSEDNDGEDWF